MKTLRFDSIGGASGDMILATFLDLGVPLDWLRDQLASLLHDPFEIAEESACSRGIAGTRVRVTVPHEHHAHRGLTEIRSMIQASRLPPDVQALSLEVFERLAEVEARIHQTTPDKIHFHEVGAMDSIIDIVGACMALLRIAPRHVLLGPLPVGQGTIHAAHGILPLPVPATAELLRGHAVVQTSEPYELVTPTGAALLTTWARRFPAGAAKLPATIRAIGYGMGHRTLNERSNCLRATLLESAESADESESDECVLLECNVDDTVPQLFGALTDQLLAAGALDVFLTPVQMKKQRPGIQLSVLCRPADQAALTDLIFAETTTFGIREQLLRRSILSRRHVEVQTPYGSVRIKVGARQGRILTRAPEYADCLQRAREAGVAVRAVLEAAQRAASDLA